MPAKAKQMFCLCKPKIYYEFIMNVSKSQINLANTEFMTKSWCDIFLCGPHSWLISSVCTCSYGFVNQ